MKLLNEYFRIQKEIYDYFGYVEDWVVIPIDDATGYFWYIQGDEENEHGEVVFAKKVEDFFGEEYYANEIYRQRFLPKWIYKKEDYTMICVDTHTDGNKFLQIFDNKKKVNPDTIRSDHV